MREMMRDYLKNNDVRIKDGYDYRNKETDNSRNGHSSKTMHTASSSYASVFIRLPALSNGLEGIVLS